MSIYYSILYFFVYGFLGWCTEVIFAAFKQHRFVNRGFLNGPICPIYGVGVTLVIACLEAFQSNLLLLYISSVILVTVLEGVTGWAMDKLFHNKCRDSSGGSTAGTGGSFGFLAGEDTRDVCGKCPDGMPFVFCSGKLWRR